MQIACNKENAAPILLAVVWGANALVSCVYVGLTLTTFSNVRRVTARVETDSSQQSAYLYGLLGSCMLGFFLVVLYFAASVLIVLRYLFRTKGEAGYGFLLSSSFHTSVFLLLAGLVLNAYVNLADAWLNAGAFSTNDVAVFTATFSFSYILSGGFLAMFGALLFAGRIVTPFTDRGRMGGGLGSLSGGQPAPLTQATELASSTGSSMRISSSGSAKKKSVFTLGAGRHPGQQAFKPLDQQFGQHV